MITIVLPYEPIEKSTKEMEFFLKGYERIREHADLKIINHKNKPCTKLQIMLHKHGLSDALINVDITSDKYYTGTEMYWTLIPQVYEWAQRNITGPIFFTEPDVYFINSKFFEHEHGSEVYVPRLYTTQYDIVQYALKSILKRYHIRAFDTHYNTCFVYTKDPYFASDWLQCTHELNARTESIKNPLHKSMLQNFNEEIAFSQLGTEYTYVPYGTANKQVNYLKESYHHCDTLNNMSRAHNAVEQNTYEYRDGNPEKLYSPKKDIFVYTDLIDRHILGDEPVEPSAETRELEIMLGCTLKDNKFVRGAYPFENI